MNQEKRSKVTKTLLVASLAGPMLTVTWSNSANAYSENYIDRILNIKSDYNAAGTPDINLYVTEDEMDFTTGDTFRVVLPPGVEWNRIPSGLENGIATLDTPRTLSITPGGPGIINEDGDGNDKIKIPLDVKVTDAIGELKVRVESMDSQITSGEYAFATVSSGKTTTIVESVKTIGDSEADGGQFRIEETAGGQLTRGTLTTLKLKLPSRFSWGFGTELKAGGGLQGTTFNVVIDGNTLTATANISSGDNTRGYIYIKPRIKAESDAPKGDVTVSVSGSQIDSADVVIAKYEDWGAKIKVEEVPQILSSKFDDKKVVKMTIEENIAGALIGGRNVEIEFPDAVKIPGTVNPLTGIIVSPSINYSGSDVTGTVNAERNTVTFAIPTTPSSSKRKLVFEAALAVKTGVYGDIKATVQGAGIEKQEVVIAKSIPPGIPKPLAEGKLKIGLQGQAIPDIILAETVKGAVKQSVDLGVAGKQQGYVLVYFSRGVTFTGTPKIKVIEGDLLIDSVQVIQAKDLSKAPTDMYEGLKIDIKGESTKPSKIQISDIKLSVDRSVPEGILEAKIAGSAVAHPYNSLLFNITSGIPFKVADVITPAPSETNLTGSFVIGSTTYKIGDVEKTMDAAPYIKNDRTYLPVRYVAEVMGINEDNIVWDKASQTVSLFKGNKVVQIKMGVKKITVNGADITTDVAPEIKNERMMLPIAHVAQALGSKARWDAESKTVYIE